MNASLLLVDGNKRYRERLTAFFTAHDYHVAACANYEDAWVLLQDRGFDIAIVDFSIGRASGAILCGFISSYLKELTSLIITNRRQSKEIERYIRGFSPVYYFIKPSPLNDLHAVIAKTLEWRARKKLMRIHAVNERLWERKEYHGAYH
jgi:DNA-binding NtrC family response regulator